MKEANESESRSRTSKRFYIPNKQQYNTAMKILYSLNPNEDNMKQRDAASMVAMGYTCNTPIHFSFINLINETIKKCK